MQINTNSNNVETLQKEIAWFKQVLTNRITSSFDKNAPPFYIDNISAPSLIFSNSPYARLIQQEKISKWERLIVLLALMPIVQPETLDVFFTINSLINRPFTEFGGKYSQSGGFIPTIETALFLLGGKDLSERLRATEIFSPQADFPIWKMIDIERNNVGESIYGGILTVKNSYFSLLIEGRPYYPRFSNEFPAERLTTSLTWDNLILNQRTTFEVDDILRWLEFNHKIGDDWAFKKHIRRGYRALFYGPAGTGKTLTASLLGKKMNKEVYRVDLSKVISKYIGETEKNMANIFDQAEDKDWILFFDEADALFGKRTKTSSSNDQHSNQQVAYLLQRIENYPGVIVLATNLRGNMDKAFARRFQSIINFMAPDQETRLLLWKAILPPEMPLAPSVELTEIARKYRLTGGMIVNITHYAVLDALARGLDHLTEVNLIEGIRREMAKEGKT